jgi:hypothetical protein
MVMPFEVLIAKAFRIFAECVRQLRTLSSFSDKISWTLLIVWRAILPYVICGTDSLDYVRYGHVLKCHWWWGNDMADGVAYAIHDG